MDLPTAGASEHLVRTRGLLILVTDHVGDVAPACAKDRGLFFEDTRYLSSYHLSVRDAYVIHLASEMTHGAYNQIDMMLSGLEAKALLDDPQNYVHIRRRQLLDESLIEEIAFTNFLTSATELEVELSFGADFADVFEVRGAQRERRGTFLDPVISATGVELAYEGVDRRRYVTHVTFDPVPEYLTADHAIFRLSLPRDESKILTIEIRPTRVAARTVPFSSISRRLSEEAKAFRASSTRFRCDNVVLQHALDQAVSDLHALRVSFDGHRIVAAGTPWFSCPFGRDSLLTSYSALLLNPALAVETLLTLAAYQGTHYVEETEEEPGKIFHELRFGEMTHAGEMPHSPYYGSVDATPLFVIVADALLKTTGEVTTARALEHAVRAALGWLDLRTQLGTSFLTYEKRSPHGLDNQGWKDSRAGVSHPDGRRATPPIALCEVQGYCVDAYRRGSRFLAALGHEELAGVYARRAERFAELFETEFWLPELGRYAYAIDGRGERLRTVVSNLGHLLWSRATHPDRAKAIATLLTSPPSFSGFGVRTLASGQAVYNPLSYHNGTVWPHDNAIVAKGMSNYSLAQPATRIFEGLLAALDHFRDRRLPELFCGLRPDGGGLVPYPVACSPQAWASAAPFLLLQASLGLHVDGRTGGILIRNPNLPPSVNRLDIDRLRVGEAMVSLGFRREGTRCHVDRVEVTGGELRTDIALDFQGT